MCDSGQSSRKIYASGAAKRKRKLEIETNVAKLPKVTSFFTLQRSVTDVSGCDAGPSGPGSSSTGEVDLVSSQSIINIGVLLLKRICY
jgi:hypothetical protein